MPDRVEMLSNVVSHVGETLAESPNFLPKALITSEFFKLASSKGLYYTPFLGTISTYLVFSVVGSEVSGDARSLFV